MFVVWFVLACILHYADLTTAQFFQTDYEVKPDRIVIDDYNRTYFSKFAGGLDWYNRTTRVINGNAILLKDLSKNIKVDIQVYKFLSNEFRFFPITMTGNGCVAYGKNLLGSNEFLAKYSNIPKTCPIKKGVYFIRNGIMDFSQFPPHMPSGTYKFEGRIYNNNDFVTTIYAVGTISENNKLLG